MAGLQIRKVAPVYPDRARRAKIQGPVVLRALIDKQGRVTEVAAVSGDPLLASAAKKAVRRWRYMCRLHDGDCVDVETLITLNFALGGC